MDIKEKEKRVRKVLEAEKNRPEERLYLIKKIQENEDDFATPQSVDYGSERVDSGITTSNNVERFAIDKHIKLENMKSRLLLLDNPSKEYTYIINWLIGDYYTIIRNYYSLNMNDEEISLERARHGLSSMTRFGVKSKRARIIRHIAEHCDFVNPKSPKSLC